MSYYHVAVRDPEDRMFFEVTVPSYEDLVCLVNVLVSDMTLWDAGNRVFVDGCPADTFEHPPRGGLSVLWGQRATLQ